MVIKKRILGFLFALFLSLQVTQCIPTEEEIEVSGFGHPKPSKPTTEETTTTPTTTTTITTTQRPNSTRHTTPPTEIPYPNPNSGSYVDCGSTTNLYEGDRYFLKSGHFYPVSNSRTLNSAQFGYGASSSIYRQPSPVYLDTDDYTYAVGEKKFCEWKFHSKDDCQIQIRFISYYAGNNQCKTQYILLSDNIQEIMNCGGQPLAKYFKSESSDLLIKHYVRHTSKASTFRAVVTCKKSFADRFDGKYFATEGCKKLTGISKIPLVGNQSCDASDRDACGLLSNNSTCHSTGLDVYTPFMLNCKHAECSDKKPPQGISGVLKCIKSGEYGYEKITQGCVCPYGTRVKYACSICSSPDQSVCFCCTNSY